MKCCFDVTLMYTHKPEAQFILLFDHRAAAVETPHAAPFVLNTLVNVAVQHRSNTGLSEEANQLLFLAQLQCSPFEGAPEEFHCSGSRCRQA